MDKESLRLLVSELFNMIEDRVKGKLILLIAVNALEGIALSLIDQFAERLEQKSLHLK